MTSEKLCRTCANWREGRNCLFNEDSACLGSGLYSFDHFEYNHWKPKAPARTPKGQPDAEGRIWGCGQAKPEIDVDHHHVELPAKLPENPKAIHGRSKPTLALLPGGAMIPMSRVFELGATKYGPYNWRKDPVEAETYVSAAQRHLLSWFDGEDIDPESGQPHIAHVACCMAILLDAASCGKLIDNRPRKGTSADLIRALTKPLENIA